MLIQSILEVCTFNGKKHEAHKQCAILPVNQNENSAYSSTDNQSEALPQYTMLITAAMNYAAVRTLARILSHHSMSAYVCILRERLPRVANVSLCACFVCVCLTLDRALFS
jgi:hypothetical protein